MAENTQEQDEVARLLAALVPHGRDAWGAARIFDSVLRELVAPQHSSVFWGDRMLTLDRAAAFRDEPAFAAARARTQSSTGQNQYASPDGISWRFHTLIWAARSCLELPGDYVECGVFFGDMSFMVTENVDLPAAGKQLHLYDTFAGFDSRYSSPADFPRWPEFFDLAQREYTKPGIEDYVRERFRNKTYVAVVRGSVPDVLHAAAPARIALLHLDLNSPAAERAALEILFDRVVAGGMIIFDDYGWQLFDQQRLAIDAFLKLRQHSVLELPTGQGLMIKR